MIDLSANTPIGGSSGIGLATLELLQSLGATVVSGDIQQPPKTGNFTFVQTDVLSWADIKKLFKAAKDKHGRIDYVFAKSLNVTRLNLTPGM